VEDSIASRLQAINADMLGMVNTLASIQDVQQSSAVQYAELNAMRRTQLDELHATISSQHSTLVKMAESNQMHDAQLVKHSERMDRMEILFERMHSQIPNMTRCVELCLEVGAPVRRRLRRPSPTFGTRRLLRHKQSHSDWTVWRTPYGIRLWT
jgi:hypothetical protein